MSQISVISLPPELLAGIMQNQEMKCTEGLSKCSGFKNIQAHIILSYRIFFNLI